MGKIVKETTIKMCFTLFNRHKKEPDKSSWKDDDEKKTFLKDYLQL